MQIRVVNDVEGCPAISLVNPETGETVQSVELGRTQELTITLPEIQEPNAVQFSVTDVPDAPAEGDGAN